MHALWRVAAGGAALGGLRGRNLTAGAVNKSWVKSTAPLASASKVVSCRNDFSEILADNERGAREFEEVGHAVPQEITDAHLRQVWDRTCREVD